ncbi:MAG TPA: TIGR00730 family Rossman fold protein, partial [Alcanivorax sp.]|nr:TIGR00730 family Rossman fold protein [Alcanivorax sp.]
DHATEEQFLRPHHRGMLIVESQPAALLDRMSAYQPPQAKQWVKKDEL